jgi:hypothetical protein
VFGRGRRRLEALALVILIIGGAGRRASSQDSTSAHERKPETEKDRGTAGAIRGPGVGATGNEGTTGVELPTRYDPDDEWPPPEREPVPAGPTPEQKPSDEGRSFLDGIELKTNGRTRLEFGHDSNVIRTSDAHIGTFFHGLGEVEALARFQEGRELFMSLTGEGVAYFPHRSNADEMYVSGFAEYFHPALEWLDVGLQNTLEYSRQNLLDDNGDLLPRESFNAWDEEPRAFAIMHAGDQASLELGTAYRWKNFEEVRGKTSLDFEELRFDAAIRVRIPWWADGKLKVKYRFRERTYHQLLALDRRAWDTNLPDLTAPKLVIERHQVNTTVSQKLHPFETELTIALGYGFTYNLDIFANDRSYRENAGSLRIEWWLVKDWTRVEAEVRGGGRDFVVRRVVPPVIPSPSSPLLRHRFIDVSFLVWQQVVEHLAAVVEVSWFDWGSSEPGESYRRLVAQGGIEASF